MATTSMTIGELAGRAETKVVTVRYYERIGLLPPPERGRGNYRTYDSAALERLRFIRRCRGLGFPLDQVRALLELASDAQRPCDEVDRMTAAHLAAVERKIADLAGLAAELQRIAAACRGGGTISSCRILDAIAPG